MFSPLHLHRICRWLHLRKVRFFPIAVQRINYFFTGCDLPGDVQIGRRVRFQHYGSGVVIHNRVTIGDDVMIMPHVVIGQNVRAGVAIQKLDHIYIGNRVIIGAGAKIIATGTLRVGDGSVIGANAVLLTSLPDDCTAVGIPAKILKRKDDMPPEVPKPVE